MKKTLLTMFALAATLVSQAGLPGITVQSKDACAPMHKKAVRMSLQQEQRQLAPVLREEGEEATSEGEIKFCEDLDSWITFKANLTYILYITVPQQVAEMYNGVQITSITTSMASDGRKSIPAKIFVTDEVPTATSTFVTSEDVTFVNLENSETFTFSTPHVVDGTKDLYFGVMLDATAEDWPMPVDGGSSASEGLCGTVYLTNGSQSQTTSFSEIGYGNLWLYASYTGELTPKLIPELTFLGPDKTFTTVRPGDQITYEVDFKNNGSIALTDYDIELSLDGGEPVLQHLTFDDPIEAFKSGYDFSVQTMPSTPGRHSATAKVTKVNGEDVDFPEFTHPVYVVPDDVTYSKRLMVEEFTGLWCGWCPMGIVGLEQMYEEYPDNFIGIPAHYDDSLQAETYIPLIKKFAPGFPSMAFERDPSYIGFQPNHHTLSVLYPVFMQYPVPADLKLTVDFDGADETKTAKAVCETTFAADEEDADYRLAFIAVQRKIRASQTNNFAGGDYGTMGGWENKSSSAVYSFPETARAIYDVWGLEGSVPASIKGGETNKYEYEVSLAEVTNLGNAEVVAILLDGKSGCVLNAAKMDAESGVHMIGADKAAGIRAGKGMMTINGSFATAQVYTLSGVKVAQFSSEGSVALPAGIYVVNVDGNIAKVLVR